MTLRLLRGLRWLVVLPLCIVLSVAWQLFTLFLVSAVLVWGTLVFWKWMAT